MALQAYAERSGFALASLARIGGFDVREPAAPTRAPTSVDGSAPTAARGSATTERLTREGPFPYLAIPNVSIVRQQDERERPIADPFGPLYFVPPVLDTTPPIVSNWSPAPGSSITPTTAISFDVTEETLFRRIVVVAYFPAISGAELVHDGDSFAPLYATSSRTDITSGYRFTLARSGGWPAAPIFRAMAIDAAGNEAA